MCVAAAPAADRYIATVTITNAPTTNGMTVVLTTTAASTRTWTNSVIVPSLQILTNNTVNGIATNLQLHLQASPPAGVSAQMGNTNVVIIYGRTGDPLQITGVGNYFSVSYLTQTVTSGWTVTVPRSAQSAAQQTNIAAQISDWIEFTGNTNPISQASPAMSELAGLTNAQTITGQKIMTNALSRYAGVISNSPSISGNISQITNGTWRGGALSDGVSTNLVNHGNAFSSRGSGVSASEQFGDSATATGEASTALGYSSTATADFSTAIGTAAGASEDSATALGSAANAGATNSTAIGVNATVDVTHTNSTAIGANATTTAANQVMLGAAGISVSVQNNLTVGTNATIGGSLTVGGGARITGAVTNLIEAGQATWNADADIAFTRFAITSLANGNNAAVPVGTNVYIEVSGPSGAFTINGIANGRNGKIIIIDNQTGQDMTIANQSGTDPTAANRIITNTGADRATTGNGTAILIYSGAASRWRLISLDP